MDIDIKKEEKIKEILQDYDQKSLLYRDYLNSLTSILTLLLQKENFHPQAVLGRIKDRESLEKKLQGDTLNGFKKSTDIIDIVGLRILVYTWDEAKDLAERIQLWFSSTKKIRKPDPEYPSFNLRLSLDEKRANLPEYEKFREIPFEVQITTVLYHSWIERTHDVIYKTNDETIEISPQSLEYLKTEYLRVKEELIFPAQEKLDLLTDLTKDSIQEGTPFFPLAINKIEESHDNNYIIKVLDTLQTYTEKYGDSVTNTKDLIELLARIIVRGEQNKVTPEKTPFGTFDGKTSNDITRSCIQIYKNIQFLVNINKEYYLGEVLESLAKSYTHIKEDSNKHIIKEFIEASIKPQWKDDKIFFYPPLIYLSMIENTTLIKDFETYADFAIKPLSGMLDLRIEKTTMTAKDQLTMYSGAIPINKHSKDILERTISKLEQIFSLSNSTEIKYQVIQALHNAFFYPINVPFNQDLEKIVNKNRDRIVNFYLSILDTSNYVLAYEIEKQITYLPKKYRYHNIPVRDLITRLKQDQEYQYFKLLYGWDYWEISKAGLKLSRPKKRETIIREEIVEKLNSKSLITWTERIKKFEENLNFVQTTKDGLHILINALTEDNPKLAILLFDKIKLTNGALIQTLLRGLWESNRKVAIIFFRSYCADEDLQFWLSATLSSLENFPSELVEELNSKAAGKDRYMTISEIIRFYLYKSQITLHEEAILGKCLKFVMKEKFVGWVNNLYIDPKNKSCLESLKEIHIEKILENLVEAKEITHHIETVLNKIMTKHPDLVIEFFIKRINRKEKTKDKENYRPVPFQFDVLEFNSITNLESLLQSLYESYALSTNVLSRLYIANFCSEIWKGNPKKFDNAIQEIIRAEKKGVLFTLDIAKNIGNLGIVDNTIKYIVGSKKISEKIKSAIYGIYVTTGVVSGIYGLSDSYKEKAERIGKWAKDPNKRIADFGEEFSKNLVKQSEIERKRAADEEAKRTAHFNANN